MLVRALLPEELAAARALVLAQFGGTRYEARMLELLVGDERVVVGSFDGDGALGAVMIHGAVAGADGVWRIESLVGDDDAMVRAAAWVVAHAPRLAMAELPDDSSFVTAAAALVGAEFLLESRVDDFVAEGIALRFFSARRVTEG